MRLIDADAKIHELETQDYSCAPDTLEDWTPQDMTKAEIADINNAPTIDAEPVRHGKWIWDGEEYHCSECLYIQYGNTWECLYGIYKYCPNCGAKMDVEEEKQNA